MGFIPAKRGITVLFAGESPVPLAKITNVLRARINLAPTPINPVRGPSAVKLLSPLKKRRFCDFQHRIGIEDAPFQP